VNTENDTFLVTTYPKLYQDRYKDMIQTCMCWGFECRDGWFDLIKKTSEKLELLNNSGVGFTVVADQVKEKFGTLRFYYHLKYDEGEFPDREIWSQIAEDCVSTAESRSAYLCEVCGKYGTLVGTGWVSTLCKEHSAELEQKKAEKP
jgi:hypothetical protein